MRVPTNEGTAVNAVTITVFSDIGGRVGYTSASRSYYKFVIGTTRQYTLSATALSVATDLDLKLFSGEFVPFLHVAKQHNWRLQSPVIQTLILEISLHITLRVPGPIIWQLITLPIQGIPRIS